MAEKADKGGTAKCASCNFFVLGDELQAPGSGRCHFFPPSAYRDYAAPSPTNWPLVAASDWCGQYHVKAGP